MMSNVIVTKVAIANLCRKESRELSEIRSVR